MPTPRRYGRRDESVKHFARETRAGQGTIALLRDGHEAFPAWLAAIESAQHEILVEMYWFASDTVGWRFAEALARRAREGLDVLVLFDAIGSLGTDRALFESLTAAGAAVIEFNPIAPWRRSFRLTRVLRRDHRKLLVIDGVRAFVGGINLHDQAAPVEAGGHGWRDDCARVDGPPAGELRHLFYDVWWRRGGREPTHLAVPARRVRRTLLAEARAQDGSHAGAAHPAFEGALLRLTRPRGGRATAAELRRRARAEVGPIQVLGHPVRRARHNIRRLYLFHIRTAARAILIENAYFLPDRAVRRALRRAAARGVEVRIVVPRRSDVPAVTYASQATYGTLLRAGVHVHEWPGAMMHAKTALIDDWATVGSFNLDRRSLRFNLELNVAATAPDFVAAVEASIRDDLRHTEELDPAAWAKRSPWRRLMSWVYYLFRSWM